MWLLLTYVDNALISPITCTCDGFRLISSYASRMAARTNVSPTSTLPPVNDTSPLWLVSACDLRVSTTSGPLGPSKMGTNTADAREPSGGGDCSRVLVKRCNRPSKSGVLRSDEWSNRANGLVGRTHTAAGRWHRHYTDPVDGASTAVTTIAIHVPLLRTFARQRRLPG